MINKSKLILIIRFENEKFLVKRTEIIVVVVSTSKKVLINLKITFNSHFVDNFKSVTPCTDFLPEFQLVPSK